MSAENPYEYRVVRHTDTRWFVQRARWGWWFWPFVKTLASHSDDEGWRVFPESVLLSEKHPYQTDWGAYWYVKIYKSEAAAEEAKARLMDKETLTVVTDETREYWDIFGDQP